MRTLQEAWLDAVFRSYKRDNGFQKQEQIPGPILNRLYEGYCKAFNALSAHKLLDLESDAARNIVVDVDYNFGNLAIAERKKQKIVISSADLKWHVLSGFEAVRDDYEIDDKGYMKIKPEAMPR